MSVGDLLQELCLKTGTSWDTLCKLLKCDKSRICDIVYGNTKPSKKDINILCSHFGVSEQYFKQ